jgi:hypothetical protein
MPESEGSNVDTNTGESGTIGPADCKGADGKTDWQAVGARMTAARESGKGSF